MSLLSPKSDDDIRALARKAYLGTATPDDMAEIKAVTSQAGSFGKEIQRIVDTGSSQ